MSDATKPFHSPATPTERLETLMNDKRVLRQNKDTFASRADAELDLENTGRFAKPNTVIGRDGVQYPKLPDNSWANDPTGVEPPLGFDINETPIVANLTKSNQALII